MANNYKYTDFSRIDLSDAFFDSLKADYEEFSEWFKRKATEGAHALVAYDNYGITAFLYLKDSGNTARRRCSWGCIMEVAGKQLE